MHLVATEEIHGNGTGQDIHQSYVTPTVIPIAGIRRYFRGTHTSRCSLMYHIIPASAGFGPSLMEIRNGLDVNSGCATTPVGDFQQGNDVVEAGCNTVQGDAADTAIHTPRTR